MALEIVTTITWLIAVALYYLMGKHMGYRKGYNEGSIDGAKQLLKALAKHTDSKGQE